MGIVVILFVEQIKEIGMKLILMLISTTLALSVANAELRFSNDIHPWAFYLLLGTAPWADRLSSIVAVDCDAVMDSNAVSGLQLSRNGEWMGFTCIPNTNNLRSRFDFKYRILHSETNEAIVQCIFMAGGSDNYHEFMHVRCDQTTFHDHGKEIARKLITLLGTYSRDEIIQRYPETKVKLTRTGVTSSQVTNQLTIRSR